MSSPRTKRSLSASAGSSEPRRIATTTGDDHDKPVIGTSLEKSEVIRPPTADGSASTVSIPANTQHQYQQQPQQAAVPCRGRTTTTATSQTQPPPPRSLEQRRRDAVAKIQKQISEMCKQDDSLVRATTGADQRQAARELTADCQDWIDAAGQSIAHRLRIYERYTLPPLLQQWVATASAAKLAERTARLQQQQQQQQQQSKHRSAQTAPPAMSRPAAAAPTSGTPTASASQPHQPLSTAAALSYVQRHINSVGFTMANGHDLMALPSEIRSRIGDNTNMLSKGSCLLIIAHSIGYRPLMARQHDEQLVPLHVRIGSNGREAAQFVTCIRLNWKTFTWDHVVVERSLAWRPERMPMPTPPVQ